MRHWVVKSICEGSRVRSPFVHACTSFEISKRMTCMGEGRRGSQPTEGTKMVRISLPLLFQSGCFDEHSFVDVSSDWALIQYFGAGPSGYGTYVEENFANMARHAATTKEFLLMWRGQLPIAAFEEVDEVHGTFLRPYSQDGSQPTDWEMREKVAVLQSSLLDTCTSIFYEDGYEDGYCHNVP